MTEWQVVNSIVGSVTANLLRELDYLGLPKATVWASVSLVVDSDDEGLLRQIEAAAERNDVLLRRLEVTEES